MSAPQKPQQSQSPRMGKVKQVLSGDTVIIQGHSANNPPEMTFCFVSVTAPKLAKRVPAQNIDTPDEPYAWEAREFLRKKVLRKFVTCIVENNMSPAASPGQTQRVYGTLFLDDGKENITELMVKEGYLSVRSNANPHLVELQEAAKSARKGKWAEPANNESHIRDIKWSVDNLVTFVDNFAGKPIDAVIEHVRDGSTVRAILLPDFVHITLMMSGIKCPSKDGFADEARKFTERHILQEDVQIVLESTNNANFVGVIHHPNGSIAELLVKNGLAHCVDWSIAKMKKSDADKLRSCEKQAKEQRLRIWKDWSPPPKINDKECTGTVVEVINGDALMIKLSDGTIKKVFLAGIRPPKDPQASQSGEDKPVEVAPRPQRKRNLYDIPWMFEAREFLRKRLIGKKVNVIVDYIQPAKDSLPVKHCCTVLISNLNVAEALISRGLGTAVRYRQNDEQRASAHDALLSAELKAQKGNKGVHAKKDIPTHRINDISGDPVKAKNLLPHIMRQPKLDALVEFVTNGSRLRLYLPKDSHLITFLLSGIEVRYVAGDGVNNEEAALNFTKEKCMQREVEIQVEGTDKKGNFVGWLWVENVNLSVALVEAGLAKIHYTGENSRYSKDLQNAKNLAKSRGVWKFVEKEETSEVIEEERNIDRKVDHKEVLVVETNGIEFYCQFVSEGPKLNAQQSRLSQEMEANPPLPCAYTPKRGDTCAAKYPVDGMWYRAKIEKISGSKVSVFYVDYGNRAEISNVDCASLPSSFSDKPYAHLYTLAFVALPTDEDDKQAACQIFKELVQDQSLLLNVEYNDNKTNSCCATLLYPDTKDDIGKSLVSDGLLLVAPRRGRGLEKVVNDYKEEEANAKNKRYGMWQYGDIREDDDREFGMGR